MKVIDKQLIDEKHRKFEFSWKEFCYRGKTLQNYCFDKYAILEMIGKGSFGTVYRGIVIKTKQQVAIKVINVKEIKDSSNRGLKQIKLRLVESESRIMMMFDTNNILKCYESFQSKDFKFMILEYCNGGDLLDKIRKQQKIPQVEAISILKQLVNGIGECHNKKIIHRDLKAQNIMVHNGTYKLADFGFSKILSIRVSTEICINTKLGTPTTMAPQVKNNQRYGLKADIWSIGVIFFEMLFGQCPFDSLQNHKRVMKKIDQILEKEYFYLGVKISDNVRKFLKKVLVVNPQDRIGWRELIQEDIFRSEEKELSGSFLRRIQIKVNAEEITKIEEQVMIKNQDTQQMQIENMLRSLQCADSLILSLTEQAQKERENLLIEEIKIKKCDSQEIPFQYEPVDQQQIPAAKDEETQLFAWANGIYLQCLKTEFIYRKIIQAIESQNLLDLSNRNAIELMYLLATRCYNNMSPIYQEYSTHSDSQVLKDLTITVKKLYNEVTNKWQRYSYLLTQKENQKLQMAADWTKRVILSKLFPSSFNYQHKEKFMTGIEYIHSGRHEIYRNSKNQLSAQTNEAKKDPSLKDYTKQEQIKYILEYFNINKSDFYQPKSEKCKKVMTYLNKLFKICSIKWEDIKQLSFKQYVEQIISQ